MSINKKPLVSVIVPSFNYGKFIEQCLASIVAQSYRNLELIIVDDYSRDNSVELIKETIKKKSFQDRFEGRIKLVIHKKNKGAHFAINHGLTIAEGEFLTIINADDLYDWNRVEVMIEEIQNRNARIAFSKINVIDEYGNSVAYENEEAKRFREIQDTISEFPTIGMSLVPQNVSISTGNLLFEKRLFLEVGKFRGLKYCHDWDFILRSILTTEPIYVNKTCYHYRLHGSNTFRSLGDVADKEVAIVLGYFFLAIKMGWYKNELAPSPKNWPGVFEDILNKFYLSQFWKGAKTFKNYYLQLEQYFKDRRELLFEEKENRI